MKQNVEIISLIYKSVSFLDFIVDQLQSNFCKSDKLNVGIRIVCNDATDKVLDYIKTKNIAYSIYNDPKPEDYYLNRVYRAWNYSGMSTTYDNIIFVNSDMAFSESWLDNLFKYHDGINIPCSRLVESGKMPSGKWARGYNFGTTPANFNKQAWEDSANISKIPSFGSHGLYMPCLLKTERFKDTGGFPEGNIYSGGIGAHTSQFIKSGDDYYFHDILENEYNMKHITVFDSLVYHMQEGEKDE
jgi:hypothetical protein